MAAMEEALLKRVLPHSVEAEQSVIGSHDDRQEAIVEASGILREEDFTENSMASSLHLWWS